MRSWVIYNGGIINEKVSIVINKLHNTLLKKGVNNTLVKNNELFPTYDKLGNLQLDSLLNLEKPDFIIFWDKDLYLARHLEAMGYKLYNNLHAIETCDNKALTHLRLNGLNIRTPKTIFAPFVFREQKMTSEYVDGVFNKLGNSIIIKECYGSFGMQVYKVDTKEDFINKCSELGNRIFLLQENITKSFGKDIRVNIVGDKVIGGMERCNPNDFRANIGSGGIGKIIELSKEQKDLALKAHKAVGLDFSGVDLLYGEEGPYLCEINSSLNYLEFEKVFKLDFSEILVEYILNKH